MSEWSILRKLDARAFYTGNKLVTYVVITKRKRTDTYLIIAVGWR